MRQPIRSEHPRVCGENRDAPRPVFTQTGTSPRMRGKHFGFEQGLTGRGNIPAYAGKTRQNINRDATSAEHPRVCGENNRSQWPIPLARGTSPRMRGKPALSKLLPAINRNIPAYAGKTICLLILASSTSGTSPRMRGKRCRLRCRTCPGRNIPAYAGKTRGVAYWPES